MKPALGLIETLGFVGVTEAADAATKAAAVELSAVEQIERWYYFDSRFRRCWRGAGGG